jgi:DNA-binding NtrC family response regulator
MKKKSADVIFLDDNEDLRELMPILLSDALGVDCRSFESLTDLQSHVDEAIRAQVAILDINLGENSLDGVDALNWLRSQGFGGKIVFFTGHARTNPHVAEAERSGVQILEKPIDADKLISFVQHAINGNR